MLCIGGLAVYFQYWLWYTLDITTSSVFSGKLHSKSAVLCVGGVHVYVMMDPLGETLSLCYP